MVAILVFVGFIHAGLFMMAIINIHEDTDASSTRRFFAFIIALFLPIIGPIISERMVDEPIPIDVSGVDYSSHDGGYTSGGDSGSSGGSGDGGGCG